MTQEFEKVLKKFKFLGAVTIDKGEFSEQNYDAPSAMLEDFLGEHKFIGYVTEEGFFDIDDPDYFDHWDDFIEYIKKISTKLDEVKAKHHGGDSYYLYENEFGKFLYVNAGADSLLAALYWVEDELKEYNFK